MKITIITAFLALVVTSASAGMFTSTAYFAWNNWPRYARTQGRATFSEWSAKYKVGTYRKADYDRVNPYSIKPYSGGPVMIENPYVNQPLKKARRVVNPDGSETVYNPYCE